MYLVKDKTNSKCSNDLYVKLLQINNSHHVDENLFRMLKINTIT